VEVEHSEENDSADDTFGYWRHAGQLEMLRLHLFGESAGNMLIVSSLGWKARPISCQYVVGQDFEHCSSKSGDEIEFCTVASQLLGMTGSVCVYFMGWLNWMSWFSIVKKVWFECR
jgi:hypothetical protein